MLDLDAGKLLIIGVVALVVIGPKDLPRVLRQAGQWIGKLRRMAHDFQGQFMEAVKEADLQDLREEVAKLKDSAAIDVRFDPAREVHSELIKAVEAPVSRGETAAIAEPASDVAPSTPSGEGTDTSALAAAAPVAELAGPAAVPVPVMPIVSAEEGAISTSAEAGRRARQVPRRRVPPRRFDGAPRDQSNPVHRPRMLPPVRRETPEP